MPTTTPGKGAATPARSAARVREAMARVGVHVRGRVSEPVDAIRLSAQRILSDTTLSEEMHQAALEILSSAERISEELGALEDSASIAFANDPLFSRPPQAPQPLTNALAGELTHLARQADSPLKTPQVALLKPHLKRAARLANLWLSTTIEIEPTGAQSPLTSTLGPVGEADASRTTVVRRTESPPRVRTQESPAAAAKTPPAVRGPAVNTAARALASKVERLKAQNDDLQARYDARERHWRGAIHEIRNAAQAFVSWTDMLRHSEITSTPWFAPLKKAAEALQRRAEEVAARKPTEQGDMEITVSPFDILLTARSALDIVRPMADAAGVTLAFSAPMRADSIPVDADPDRTEQIIHNLLRNGIEATPPGGTVAIAIGSNERWAEVEVEDSGKGIPEDQLASIFSGTQASTSGKHGFGVGLMLSHDLATRMSCSLEVRPRLPGSGACFVLRLPRVS